MDEIELIAGIVTIILGIASFKFGAKWQQLKIVAKLSVDALTDDKITREEAQQIATAVKKLLER